MTTLPIPAEAELARIREGSDPTPPDESGYRTVGQLWHHLLTQPAEDRAAILADVCVRLDAAHRATGQLAEVLMVLRAGYHEASRWEHPLDLPQWVTGLAVALGIDLAEGGPCGCPQCTTSDERRARDRREAGLA